MLWVALGRVEPLDPTRLRGLLAPISVAAAEPAGEYAADSR
jgi:hypothetical protein